MFHVQYWSNHNRTWEDYVAPTFNAKPRAHDNQIEAEGRMSVLQTNHPNDTFRVVSDEQLKQEKLAKV